MMNRFTFILVMLMLFASATMAQSGDKVFFTVTHLQNVSEFTDYGSMKTVKNPMEIVFLDDAVHIHTNGNCSPISIYNYKSDVKDDRKITTVTGEEIEVIVTKFFEVDTYVITVEFTEDGYVILAKYNRTESP